MAFPLSKTRLIGKQFVKLTSCPSTNDIAAQLLANGSASHGTVVIADEQTKGRGQRGNTWESQAGKNLMFSVILSPHELLPQDQFRLNWVVSLAIQDYLKARNITNVFIKWPNDIYISTKKICGILIENSIKGRYLTHAIAGIGLNINQTDFELASATSLQLQTGYEYDLQTEIDYLLSFLENRWESFSEGRIAQLKQAYLSELMWLNEEHLFEREDGIFRGEIVNVDDFGRLIVKTNTGIGQYNFKEIRYLE